MEKPPSPNRASQSNPKVPAVAEALAAHIRDRDLAGGVVLIAQDGEISHFEAQGHADLEAGKPIATDAIFRVHSMTKAVTSAAALILVERGLLELDSPVSRHLPELADLKVQRPHGKVAPPRGITVRDLMRHTAGLTYEFLANGPVERAYRDCDIMDRATDLATMVEKLGKLPLKYPPGESWGYSIATDVLGRVIEVVSGVPLDSFYTGEIFQPLGMTDTGFYVPEEKLHRFPVCYTSDGKGRLNQNEPGSHRSPYAKPPTFLSGGAGLVSTATDYFRFLQMLLDGGKFSGAFILSERSVRLLTTDQLPAGVRPITFDTLPKGGFGFSLGLSVCTGDSDWDPTARVGEFGWGGAAGTHYWVSPKDRLIAIILQQTMPFRYRLEWSLKPLIYAAI